MTTTSEPAPCQQTVHFISEYLSKPPIFPVPALKMNLLVFSAAFTMIVTIHGALALRCHQCMPDQNTVVSSLQRQGNNSKSLSFCAEPSATFDCSQDPLIGNMADSCYTARVTLNTSLLIGDIEMYVLNCSVMSFCNSMKADLCGMLENIFGEIPMMDIKNCDVTCCQGDLCNNPSSPSSANTTQAPAGGGPTVKSSVKSSVPPATTLFGVLVLMAVTFVRF